MGQLYVVEVGFLERVFNSAIGEILVLKKMLQKLILLNMRCVIVKTNSKLVVDQLTFNRTNLSEFDLVIEDWHAFLGAVENYQMLHIKRIINVIAHCLAINSKNYEYNISGSFVSLIVNESYFFSKKWNKIKEKHLKTIKLRTHFRKAL